MNICQLRNVGEKEWDTVGYTVAHYSFHQELFSTLCFVCDFVVFVFCFFRGGCKDRGHMVGDREMSATGVHEVKLTKNR